MELKEFLETEEGRAQFEEVFQSYAKEKGYKAPQDVEGLVKKRDELLAKVSRLNRDETSEAQRELLRTLAEVGVDSADDLQSIVSSKDKGTDLERQLNRINKQLEESRALYDRERSLRLESEKRSTIIRALKDAGVKDTAFDLAYAYFNGMAEVEDVDGKVNVIAKDKDGLGPGIDSYIQDWAKSEAAVDYVKKPLNQGLGLSDPQGSSKKTVYTRSELLDPKIAREVMERKKAGESVTIEE